MKAALLYGTGKELKIENVPDPKVPPGWVLLRVKAAGICGTELHFLSGILSPGKIPFILGHEVAGEVEEAPSISGWTKGDRVCVYNLMNCGKCVYCKTGCDELCMQPIGQIGFSHDGGFAEYVAVPPENLVSLPKELSFSEGAVLSCGGISARHAVKLSGIGLLDTVIVDGVGGVGLMVAQVAKLAGARVIAIADSEKKAELMKSVGIGEVIVISDYENLSAKILAMTDGRGVDAFFELVGTAKSADEGIKSLAKLGRFVIIGYTKDRIDVDPLWMVIGERKLMASVQGSRSNLVDIIKLAQTGKIKVIIEKELKLESVNDGLESLRSRKSLGRKVIVF